MPADLRGFLHATAALASPFLSPIVAQGHAIAGVAGAGPGRRADGTDDEMHAAVPHADVHPPRVARLRPAGVAGAEGGGLDLEHETVGVARIHVLARGVVG